jgi:hypothetical protein
MRSQCSAAAAITIAARGQTDTCALSPDFDWGVGREPLAVEEREIHELAASQAPVRRALAALAGRFLAVRGWERLGFARLGDYAVERLGLSARSLHDLAHIDGALAALPRINTAFVRGEISWTMLRLLTRVARQSDKEEWLARARGMTATRLAREVRAVDVGAVERTNLASAAEGGGGEVYETVRIRCAPPVQGKWYRARQLAWRMAGRPVRPWQCGEMIVAEVLSAIPLASDDGCGSDLLGASDSARATVHTRAHRARDTGTWRTHNGANGGTTNEGNANNDGNASPLEPPVADRAAVRTAPAEPVTREAGDDPAGREATATPAGGDAVATATERDTTAAPLDTRAGKFSDSPPEETPSGSRHPLELPAFLQSLLANLEETDAFQLDRRLRHVVALEQRFDAALGALLFQVAHEQRYRLYGAPDLEAYARERLGISPRKVRALVRLERTSLRCPALARAYREGRVSWVRAHTLIPVLLLAPGHTQRRAWIAWATQVSVRRLQDDVDRALVLNETDPETFAVTGGLPAAAGHESVAATDGMAAAANAASAASDGALAATDCESAAATGRVPAAADCRSVPGTDDVPVTTRSGSAAASSDPGSSSQRQIGAHHRVSDRDTSLLFFRAPPDVARLFRAVLCTVRREIERRTGRLPTEGEAFEAMLEHVFDAWGGQKARVRTAHRVFARDGWRCTVPGCSSLRNLHDHHIRFRSAGGSNALGNRTTLCAWHHLRGVHAGIVRCTGTAPRALRFELGLRRGTGPLLTFGAGERLVSAMPASVDYRRRLPGRDVGVALNGSSGQSCFG